MDYVHQFFVVMLNCQRVTGNQPPPKKKMVAWPNPAGKNCKCSGKFIAIWWAARKNRCVLAIFRGVHPFRFSSAWKSPEFFCKWARNGWNPVCCYFLVVQKLLLAPTGSPFLGELTQLCNPTAGSSVPRLHCYRTRFQGFAGFQDSAVAGFQDCKVAELSKVPEF